MATARRVTKSVTFTTDPADRELLKYIEASLKRKEFETSSMLIKAALKAFFAEPEVVEDPADPAVLQAAIADNKTHLETLEMQLSELTERFNQLESELDYEDDEEYEDEDDAPEESADEGEDTPTALIEEVTESGEDPMLDRLGALLDDF